MVRSVLIAAESLADIFDRSRLGIAMAAIMRMMATTMSSSISENPFCLRIKSLSSEFVRWLNCWFNWQSDSEFAHKYSRWPTIPIGHLAYVLKSLLDINFCAQCVNNCKAGMMVWHVK